MKICTVLKGVLAKTHTVIQKKEEKRYFGANFEPI